MDEEKEANNAMLEAKNPTRAKIAWRQLLVGDIESLICIAKKIHPNLPENDQVFAERVKLFPEGCLALVEGESDELCGYAISHPICYRQPPALNCLLGAITPNADQYYIRDLAILPKARRRGLAQQCIKELLSIAGRYSTTSLISVYGTAPFWGRFGFIPKEIHEDLKKKLQEYGDDATYLECKNMHTV